MLKLPVKSPIVNGNIDLSEYAKKSDIPSIVGLASETYVDSKFADLINSAPEELDTLGENNLGTIQVKIILRKRWKNLKNLFLQSL